MKEVIYNFLMCFSKVGLFFKRLAVKIRSMRILVKVVKDHNHMQTIMADSNLHQAIYDLYISIKGK